MQTCKYKRRAKSIIFSPMNGKKSILFFLFLSCFLLLRAQENEAYNNLHKIELGTEDLRVRADMYNDMAQYYKDRNPSSAFFYVDSAVVLSLATRYYDGLAKAYRNRGYVYMHTGNNIEGLKWYKKAKEIHETYGKDEYLAESLLDIGVVLRKMGNYKDAYEHYYRALDIAKATNSTETLSRAYNNLGYLYKVESKYPQALENLLEALEHAEKTKDKKKIASRLNNIGEIYDINIGDYKRSMKYYEEALRIRKEIHDSRGMSVSLRNMGALERRRQNYGKAMIYLKEALDTAIAIHYSTLIASTKYHIAFLLQEKNQPKEALPYIVDAIKIHQSSENSRGYLWGILLLGDIHYSLGNYEKTKQHAFEAYEIAMAKNLTQAKSTSARLLAQYYAEKDSFEDAYKYSLIYQDTNKKLTDRINIAKTATLEQTRRYEAEQAAQKEKQKQIFFGSIFIFLLLLLTIMYRSNRSRKKFNHALIKKNNELQEARKKAEEAAVVKQNFLATMSHEIRTPMNAVLGFTNLLLDEEPNATQISYLRHLQTSGKQLMSILDDILDFSKLEAKKLRIEEVTFNAKSLLLKIVQVYKTIAKKKRIDLNIDLDGFYDNTHLIGDPVRLNQILANLLDNAVKFTEEGSISVKVWEKTIDENKIHLHVSVNDTGIGISEENQFKIFESFTQNDNTRTRKYGGTGLGLAICKELVEIQGGKIWVKSQLGEGSAFNFYLPYRISSEKEIALQQEYLTKPKDSLLEGLKILIVEDNILNQRILSTVLKKWKIEVFITSNGADAVQLVSSENFDLVLMDLYMPNMNGFEATKKIRVLDNDHKANVPVVAITASNLNEISQEIQEAGIHYQIGKPFKIDELYHVIYEASQLNVSDVSTV